MENTVYENLEMLYNMIKEAWGLPLSSEKCVIERDKVLDLIEALKRSLPNEISEAKRLVDAKQAYIANAKREADTIRKAAEEKAKELVDEQEVYRTAKAKSEEVISNTEKTTGELKRMANDYADSTLEKTEKVLQDALDELRKTRQSIQGAISPKNSEIIMDEDI